MLFLQLKMPLDEEKAVKEKSGVKETNLAKDAALLKEANIVKELALGKESAIGRGIGMRRETHVASTKLTAPSKSTVPEKKETISKVGGNFNASSAAEKKVMVEKKSVAVVKDCPCLRPLRLIMCADCGITFAGRIRAQCAAHPR